MHNTSPPVVWALLMAAIITPELTPCIATLLLVLATALRLLESVRTLSLSARRGIFPG